VAFAKKTKNMSLKGLSWYQILSFLYIDYIKSQFCLKRLRGHVKHGDVPKTFLLIFFDIFKCVKSAFQIMSSYAPRSKKVMPLPHLLIIYMAKSSVRLLPLIMRVLCH
jgi:hypothetical protein